jgi:hypothetical protein
MEYFIWDKQTSLIGLSASTLFNSRPDLKYDDVIVIHKKGQPENIVMIETKKELKHLYEIESDDADVVGFITSVILAQESEETMVDKLQKELKNSDELLKSDDDDDMLNEYAKMLENIINEINDDKVQNCDDELFNLPDIDYMDPECKIIDLSDVDDNVQEKKLTVSFKHAFVTEATNITDLRCMEGFNEELAELDIQREKYIIEGNPERAELMSAKIQAMLEDVLDSCDATIKIDVDKIYQYEDNLIMDCVNGQTIIVQRNVVNSMRTSAITYEKTREGTGEKYRVFYRTVDIALDECCNELIERNNTVFVVEI